jgi:formyl-CoA transferase
MVTPENSKAALGGLRVIDPTQALAGSFCSMLLADMGAEVIKVEPRAGGPARLAAVNRNKRGMAIDLERPEGAAILRKLAAAADVLVEDHPSGAAKRLGFDYERLREINPRLIYCSISGFGRTGPYAGRAGPELVAQGMSGIMSATGAEGGPPAKVGVPVTGLGAGLFAVIGILCAVRARRATGRGQLVDTSLFEAGLALSAWEATEYWYTGQIPRRLGTAHRLSAPYQAFRASDGAFTVGAANTKLWGLFADLLGLKPLTEHPKFKTVGLRLANRAELERLLEEVTVRQTRAHWLARCEAAGIPAGPIYSVAEALADPHAQARGMTQEHEPPRAGHAKALGNPVKLSRSPAALRGAAPQPGADNQAILRDLGFSEDEISRLRETGAIP